MKVPEKLYLHSTASGNVGASWLLFPLTDKDIKYARTDAFIDKVCEWLLNNVGYYSTNAIVVEYMCEDLRKAMERDL